MSVMQSKIESILVVDDSFTQRAFTSELCRELGVKLVYEAGDGREALELLKVLVLKPGLMIVDLEMPGMDGVELIQQLHQLKINIPLMVISSRGYALVDSVEIMAKSLGLTVLTGLQKPFNLESLRHALGQSVDPSGFVTDMDATGPGFSVDELKHAIDHNEIQVFYQPQVDMCTSEVKGVEALARWQHPTRGLIQPNDFIYQAEREGLIADLTSAVMHQALGQAAAWNRQGLHFSLAINLSPLSLERAKLVDEISSLLDLYALQADQIVLEITESSVVASLGQAIGVLARLRLRGFGLSIDDYGTGYSSMQQLARIPFTELKIDRSFVHGAYQRENLRVLLQSALSMARQLGLITVAEGIETIEDWRLLQASGCTLGQGFLIAKPMPAEALPAWLQNYRLRMPQLQIAGAVPATTGVRH